MDWYLHINVSYQEKCEEKYCCESILWLKDSSSIKSDVYLCFVYIPHEKNVYYILSNIDVFDNLLMDVAKNVKQGMVVLSGNLNSRVGDYNDFIVNDDLSNTIFNKIANVVTYSNDFALPSRNSEDKTCNNLSRRLLDLCKTLGLRMCNGRCWDKSGWVTFFNHLGSRVIDYVLVHKGYYDFVSFFKVLDFNMWSDHDPPPPLIEFNLRSSCNSTSSIDLDNNVS